MRQVFVKANLLEFELYEQFYHPMLLSKVATSCVVGIQTKRAFVDGHRQKLSEFRSEKSNLEDYAQLYEFYHRCFFKYNLKNFQFTLTLFSEI